MTLDLNTVLISILLGLSAWTLYTLHNLAKSAAVSEERGKENRSRIIQLEGNVGELKVDFAHLKRTRHTRQS